MWFSVISFVAGIAACQQLAILPTVGEWAACFIGLLLLTAGWQVHSSYRLLLKQFWIFALAMSWAMLQGHWQLSGRLPSTLIKQDLQVLGTVIGLPQLRGKNRFFDFHIEQSTLDHQPVDFVGKVSLVWYRTEKQPVPGDVWQLTVRLKPPVAGLNEGLFDRETRLFAQGYQAVGYVRNSPDNRRMGQSLLRGRVDAFRYQLQQQLIGLSDSQAMAMLRALVIGDKSAISQDNWQLFRQSGINHLVAISGLHISIISVLLFKLSGWLWRRSAFLCLRIPAPLVQAAAAMIGAGLYAALAGFSLPTQRALLMLLVVLGYQLLQIRQTLNLQLQWALIVVLVYSPIAVIDTSFWLSFLAVVAIVLTLQGYHRHNFWRAFLLLQFAIAFMLLPVQVVQFGELTVLGPWVNLLLIPLFSFVFVPLGLLICLLLSVVPINDLILMGLDGYLSGLDGILWGLRRLADLQTGYWQISGLSMSQIGLLVVGVVLFFLPAVRLAKVTSVILFAAALLIPVQRLKDDDLHVTLLDVGQGLSVLLRYQQNTLLYDLGPAMGGRNATRSVVIPTLNNQGVKHLNQLVISHSDKDHAGDLAELLRHIKVQQIYSGEPGKLSTQQSVHHCHDGVAWAWDAIGFRFLNRSYHGKGNNNASCVLQIQRGGQRILLTGDIEDVMEQVLLRHEAERLAAEIVVIPHHGSDSSSSTAFVNAVKADVVLNSSGYLNRYRFPHQAVLQRWQRHAAIFMDTAISGQIHLRVDRSGQMHDLYGQRDRHQRYWYWRRSIGDWR